MKTIDELKRQYDSLTYEIIGAVNELIAAHDSQVLNYLNATGIEVGLLINFGETCLKHRRFFNTSKNPTNPLKYNQRVHGIIESDKSV